MGIAVMDNPNAVRVSSVAQGWSRDAKLIRKLIAAIVLMAVAMAVLSGTIAVAVYVIRHNPPLVVRVNALNEAKAERYEEAELHPDEAVTKTALFDFVQWYYTRKRGFLTGDHGRATALLSSQQFGFPRALWYLNQQLQNEALAESKTVYARGCVDVISEQCTVDTFLADALAPDVEIERATEIVRNFSTTTPFLAAVGFYAVKKSMDQQSRKTLCWAEVTAQFPPDFPDDSRDRNPLGLVISQLKFTRGVANEQ